MVTTSKSSVCPLPPPSPSLKNFTSPPHNGVLGVVSSKANDNKYYMLAHFAMPPIAKERKMKSKLELSSATPNTAVRLVSTQEVVLK